MERSLWAVGGGKGGTGKSFLAAGLGVALAARGLDIVLVDADLGGPNLHTLLGVRSAPIDLGDALSNRAPSLAGAAAETPVPGLKLVKGADRLLFAANLNHLKKQKLLRQIRGLEAGGVIVDTGTGSSFNAVDFFLLGRPGVLVVTPEPTAIENGYLYLRSCIMRVLRLYMEYYRLRDLQKILQERVESDGASLYALFRELERRDPAYGPVLVRALKAFRPGLVVNKVRSERDALLGRSVAEAARRYLLIELDFLGAVPYDERVSDRLERPRPFLVAYPDSAASVAVRAIAERLLLREAAAVRVPESRRAAP
jgi:flagellar biosynthesis protein FlhG